MTPKRVVDPTFARSKEYLQVIQNIAKSGKCPFCPENFKYHKKPILKETNTWLITKNSWPYPSTKHHFLIICKQHKEIFSELTTEDFIQVHKLINWAINKYQIKGGGITLRFGKTKYTGASVCHLHFHFLVPQVDAKTQRAKTVTFPIG